jgi:hypothetical protein
MEKLRQQRKAAKWYKSIPGFQGGGGETKDAIIDKTGETYW